MDLWQKLKNKLKKLTKKELEDLYVEEFGEDRIDRRLKKHKLVDKFIKDKQAQEGKKLESAKAKRNAPKKIFYGGEEYYLVKEHDQGFCDYKSKTGKNLSDFRGEQK